MLQVKINIWSPHPTQKQVRDSTARYKVIVAGRRWGKTVMSVVTLVRSGLLKAGGNYFYIAPTYRQGKMIAWKLLAEKVRLLPPELVSKINESELSITFANGSSISIKGADNPDSLRGIGLDGVVLDEFADMKAIVWEEIIRPALVDKQGWAMFIGTPKGFNVFYELYNKALNKEGWEAWKFTTYDNPTIPTEEIELAKKEVSDDKFAQEFMADFRKYEGAVYKEFDRTKHIFAEGLLINKKEEIAGIDWGYTNPTAMLRIYVDNDDVFHVMDEFYQRQRTTEEVIVYLKTWTPDMVYPDPAEPDRNKMLSNAGFYVRDVNKDIKTGIDKVRELFRNNKIKIHESCVNLIRELEMYQYPDDKLKEVPIKENDHLVDALRYALFMHEGRIVREQIEIIEEDKPLYPDIGI